MSKIEVGDIVVCILNSKSNLKIGKDYKVLGLFNDEAGKHFMLRNDKNELRYYNTDRFLTKNNFRNLLIDESLNSDISILRLYKDFSRIFEMRKDGGVISYYESLSELQELNDKFIRNKLNFEFDEDILDDENICKFDEEKL